MLVHHHCIGRAIYEDPRILIGRQNLSQKTVLISVYTCRSTLCNCNTCCKGPAGRKRFLPVGGALPLAVEPSWLAMEIQTLIWFSRAFGTLTILPPEFDRRCMSTTSGYDFDASTKRISESRGITRWSRNVVSRWNFLPCCCRKFFKLSKQTPARILLYTVAGPLAPPVPQ